MAKLMLENISTKSKAKAIFLNIDVFIIVPFINDGLRPHGKERVESAQSAEVAVHSMFMIEKIAFSKYFIK
ncbi:hypothetical protein [Fibrobacter sp.]|uniref:hypothetical protein n=1 Tax=Fibrobacter sp. TaxID=35828 RepID=UPI00388EFE4F